VYSFADLAANWAGMLFFLALFEDIDVEGDRHARYFERTASGGYRLARAFHWSEWISPDWDEVLNPAAVPERALLDKVADNMRRRAARRGEQRKSICDHYQGDPAAFLGPHRYLLARSRYAVPCEAADAAPHALDVREICRPKR
jgi:hypothetical protein